jgi:hypothetical protein
MGRNVIDIAYTELDAPSTGQLELQTAMELEIDDTDPGAGVVKTMRRSRKAIGHKSGVPEYTATLKVAQTVPPEVDWFALKRTKELVQLLYEEAAGNQAGDRYTLEDGRVTEIKRSFTQEGEAAYDVTILFLGHEREG